MQIPIQFFLLLGLIVLVRFFPDTLISISNSFKAGLNNLSGVASSATNTGQKLSTNTVKTSKSLVALAPLALKILGIALLLYFLAIIGLIGTGITKSIIVIVSGIIAAIALFPDKINAWINNLFSTDNNPISKDLDDIVSDEDLANIKTYYEENPDKIPENNDTWWGKLVNKLFGGG